jgi:PsbP-like protein
MSITEKNKLLLFALIALLSVTLVISSSHPLPSSLFFFDVFATTVPEGNNNLLTYENATLGISLQYPHDWVKEEQDESGVIFISPPSNNNSELSSVMVNVQIANLSLLSPSNSSSSLSSQLLQNYTDSTITELTAGNFSIIESNCTTFGLGNNYTAAHKLVFSKQEEGFTIQQMQIYAVRDTNLYLITYVAEAANYPIYLPTVHKMIDSFRIMDYQRSETRIVGR